MENNQETKALERAEKLSPAVVELFQMAENMAVISPETYGEGADIYKVLNNEKKRLDAERKSWVDPLNKQVKRINDAFRPMIDSLKASMAAVKGKLTEWDREQARLARLEQARLEREAEEKLQTEREFAMANGEFEKAEELVEMGPPPVQVETQTKTYGRVATGYQKKVKKYRILDFAAVPDEYKMLDERKVREAIKEPGKKIPGVETYEEIETVVR